MSEHFADRLLAACRDRGAPVCVGIDPVLERLPARMRDTVDPRHARQCVKAIDAFCRIVMDVIAPHAPMVKFQSACFERYLWPGVESLHGLMRHARELGLLTILDAKRGDIGSSSAHYAAGCLAEPAFDDLGALVGPDALTVNSYLGVDGIQPMLDVARREGKGLFALVRTSNPGGDALQTATTRDGGRVVDVVADTMAAAGATTGMVGDSGYSLLGAVVGATRPEDAAALRTRMPQQVFLVPGFGAQGGTAADVRACFDRQGRGAIVSASRSILFAYEKDPSQDWRSAVDRAAAEMKRQVAEVLRS